MLGKVLLTVASKFWSFGFTGTAILAGHEAQATRLASQALLSPATKAM